MITGIVAGQMSQGGGGGGGDPFWANVVLLVNQDQPTLTDKSSYANSLAYLGGAVRNTTIVKYGTGSLEVDGYGDQVYMTSGGSHLAFGTGDFTVEAWCRMRSDTGSNGICGNWDAVSGWALRINNNQIIFYFAGSLVVKLLGSSYAMNTWYHIAASRVSGVLRLFVDGVQIGTDYSSSENVTSTAGYAIGNMGTAYPTNNCFDGWLDDVRITKGVGRYASSFTPPSKLPTS